MKQRFLIIALCLSILFFTSNGWADECCCTITCTYEIISIPYTIDFDQCWDSEDITSCDPDSVCLQMRPLWSQCTTPCVTKGSCHTNESCSLSYLLVSDNHQLDTLRAFRDEVLSQSPVGQEIIELYYQWSPAIVKAMEEDEEFKEEVKEMIDGVLELIGREVE